MIRLLLILLILLPSMAHAKALDYSQFNTLPILDAGRMKPLQSFARSKLKELSGREALEGMSAEEWLAVMFFEPERAAEIPMVFLQNKTIAGQFEVSTDKHLYSMKELKSGLLKLEEQAAELLQQDETDLNQDQRDLIATYKRAGTYMSLTQTVAVLSNLQSSSTVPFAVKGWKELDNAYKNKDTALWNKTLSDMNAATSENANLLRFQTENLYRKIKPYSWVLGFYALGIALALFARHRLAITATALAITAHASAIAARIYILERPPVGTLYESVLFVSIICAIIGLIITITKRDNQAVNTASIIAGNASAFGLLAIAPAIAPESDSLEVLAAVLNTNFWLATHVLCITIGYGVCALAATLAHFALAAKALNPDTPFWRPAQKTIYKISLVSLFFVIIGTILGGIWADQSWGRFWGWDPKENGALLIALWLIWAHHGKVSGHLKGVGFLALTAMLNVVVALAWFGVNLLSVGLHSYGFTSGMAEGLAAFCIIETLLIAILVIRIKTQEKSHAS
jgi:ABC-type transport system involved in cytochrome c biogenesis permease subunit